MPEASVVSFTKAALGGLYAVLEVTDTLDGETLNHRFSIDGLDAAMLRLPCAVQFHKGKAQR